MIKKVWTVKLLIIVILIVAIPILASSGCCPPSLLKNIYYNASPPPPPSEQGPPTIVWNDPAFDEQGVPIPGPSLDIEPASLPTTAQEVSGTGSGGGGHR